MIEQHTVIPHIIDQHAEEAAFLWLLRNNAVHAPHYDLDELAILDERVAAHLDGLRISGDYGWQTCLDNLQFKEAGEAFAAAILAFESNDAAKIKKIYQELEISTEMLEGLTAALSWIEPKQLQGKVRGMLDSQHAVWRQVAIAACANHRIDPGKYLENAIKDDDEKLRIRALKAASQLARVDLLPDILDLIKQVSSKGRLWAAWSAVLLGDRDQSLAELTQVVHQQKHGAEIAGQVLFRCVAPANAKLHFRELIEQQAMRSVIQNVGVLGEVDYIPWLIKQMETTEFARVAGESFSLITGIDLAYDDLERGAPENFSAGPTEEADDDDTNLDADEDLPWPDPVLVLQWWQQHKARFESSIRYLCGDPVSKTQCLHVLKTGQQRQRKAAALELALMDPEQPLFETRARARRQQQLLGLI